MTYPHHPPGRQPRQFQRQFGRHRKRAFGPDQQSRGVRGLPDQFVEIIAADPPLDLREGALDLSGFGMGDREQPFQGIGDTAVHA